MSHARAVYVKVHCHRCWVQGSRSGVQGTGGGAGGSECGSIITPDRTRPNQKALRECIYPPSVCPSHNASVISCNPLMMPNAEYLCGLTGPRPINRLCTGRCHDVIAARRAMINPFCVIQLLHFCTFLLKPHLDLEPDFIIRKPIKRRFQQYLVRTEILSTFHTRVECTSRRTIRYSAHSNECAQTDKSENSICASFTTFTWRI